MTSQINTSQIIASLKAFAWLHYNQGYDTFVECYSDSEWEEFLVVDCHGSEKEARAMMATLAAHYSEQQADAAYYADQAKEFPGMPTEAEQEALNALVDECDDAHEWECEMAAMRHAENNAYSGYNETDYMYDERNF